MVKSKLFLRLDVECGQWRVRYAWSCHRASPSGSGSLSDHCRIAAQTGSKVTPRATYSTCLLKKIWDRFASVGLANRSTLRQQNQCLGHCLSHEYCSHNAQCTLTYLSKYLFPLSLITYLAKLFIRKNEKGKDIFAVL